MIQYLMRMTCLLLLASEREGRLYNGRRKQPALTAQRLRSGPHVCFSGMGSGCCPGWTVSPGTGQCLQPLCSFGCGSGYCIAPNVCSCRDGHQGITCTDHYIAEYEKELEDKGGSYSCLSAMCDQGCKMINGAAMCTCFHGFILGKDGTSCYDIDECSRPQALSPCQHQCKNSIGSYRCQCYYGYQVSANGRSCLPAKHPNTIAASSPCGEYGCELSCNDGGCEHVSRVCPIGYQMTETANGVTCTDVNQCTASSCEGTCLNTEGGYVCDCGPGLKLAADRSTCLDIDECSTHRSVCQHRCKNFHGSYRCLCGTGFTLHNNGRTCADINECRRPGTSHLCQHFCHNSHGSFFCSCRAGFVLGTDRVSCVDINECLENTTLCISGSCMNTLGSYVCSCPAGFQSINGGCSAIPLETQTASLLQAIHSDWMPLKPTPVPVSLEAKTTTATYTEMTTTKFSEELFTTKSTSTPQIPTTTFDPVPPPQHLKTGQSAKPSGISHVPLKADTMPTGQPAVLPTNAPCWHDDKLWAAGSTWTEPGCLDCTCQEGKVSCEIRVCPCTHPVFNLECPSCDGCLFEGTLRADGELFPISPDNCTVCICLAGNITCIPPVCPPVTCTEPIMSDCCLRCPDGCEFQGQIYPHGAKFSRDENGCTSCLCQNGVVECSFVPCPSLECPREDWVLEAGECCFKCQEPPPRTGCPFDDNGIEIPVGQIWSPGDPCSVCICQADSSIVCKKTDCVETCPHPITVPGQCCPDCSAGCSYGRRTYKNNESFPSTTDPCLNCICLVGTVACSPIECAPNCTYPFHDEGECCPVCRDCTYEGRKVLNRQTFTLESEPCIQCTCLDGEVQCDSISCATSCSHPYIFPGECCASCEECAFEGHVLENGRSYVLKADPCVVCHCYAGNVHCEQREGSCTPCEEKTQDCLNEVSDPFFTKPLQFPQQDAGSQDVKSSLRILSGPKSPSLGHLSLSQKQLTRKATTVPSFSVSSSMPEDYDTHIEDPISAVQYELRTDDEPYTQMHLSAFTLRSSTQSEDSFGSSTSSVTSSPGHLVTFSGTVSEIATFLTPQSSSEAPSQTSSTIRDPSYVPGSTSPYTLSLTPTPSPETTTSGIFLSFIDLEKSSPSLDNNRAATVTSQALEGTTTAKESHHLPPTTRHPHHQHEESRTPLENTEDTLEAEDERHPSACSLNGFSFINGSIYVTDADSCLQCECLNSEIYCRAEAHLPNGLCCQDCYQLLPDSCSGESNQIYSEQGEGREFCKCQDTFLLCRSCSSKPGCNREGTSQSSESELNTQDQANRMPLIIEEPLKVWNADSSP